MDIHCKFDELIDPNKLKNHPKNRNKHGQDQIERLAELYKYHGIRHPIIVSEQSGFIVAGHGRKLAAIRSGVKEMPVVFQSFSDSASEYAFLQADNAIASWAELDIENIKLDIGDFPNLDLNMLGIRDFQADELKEFLSDPDDIPKEVEQKAKFGEIYQLENHRLMCGDSTDLSSVEKLMNGEKADMVWTDPPYNVAYTGKTKDALTIKNDAMSAEQFYEFLYAAYLSMFANTKEGGAIYVAHADSEGMNFRKAMIDAGWMLKQCLIWVKQTIVLGRQDYHWKHEPILYGWKGGAAHNWYTDRKQSTVLEFDKPARNGEHPTMKPVELIEYCIKNSCGKRGLVLDLFGGSGSTLIACEKNGFKAALMELDPRYCDVIIDRWEKFTGKKAELTNG